MFGNASRIAVVGAYGNGKTTLSMKLSEQFGLRRTHGTPMRNPSGIVSRSLEDTTEPELIQLTVRRFAERAVGEATGSPGFVSDGSVLHEWVYAKIRLVLGRHPAPGATLRDAPRSPRIALYEEIADQIGLLAQDHARTGYDCFVHVPAEVPLADEPPPIGEHFRILSDSLLLDVLADLGPPVYIVTGSLSERVSQVRASLEQGLEEHGLERT